MVLFGLALFANLMVLTAGEDGRHRQLPRRIELGPCPQLAGHPSQLGLCATVTPRGAVGEKNHSRQAVIGAELAGKERELEFQAHQLRQLTGAGGQRGQVLSAGSRLGYPKGEREAVEQDLHPARALHVGGDEDRDDVLGLNPGLGPDPAAALEQFEGEVV